jgi:hypothetical protein
MFTRTLAQPPLLDETLAGRYSASARVVERLHVEPEAVRAQVA